MAPIAAYLTVIGSGFYLTQVTSISPIYPLFGAGAAITVGLLSRGRRALVPWGSVVPWGAQVPYLLLLAPGSAAIGYAVNVIALVLSGIQFSWLKRTHIERCRNVLVIATLTLGTAEAAIRWTWSSRFGKTAIGIAAEAASSEFYRYKFGSVMYQDSNFVGMWLVVVFLFAMETREAVRRPLARRVEAIGLLALLAASLCRAAIVTACLYLLARWALRLGRGARVAAVAIVGAAAIALVGYVWSALESDGSFQTKLQILASAQEYASVATTQDLLLGIGVGSSVAVLGGIAAHNFLVNLLVECGIVGLVLTLSVHCYYMRRGGRAAIAVLLGYYVGGMSMAPLTAPYLYVVLQLTAECARHQHMRDNHARRATAAEHVWCRTEGRSLECA